MSGDQLAQKLNGRKQASGWQAKCPAHEDKTASLSIKDGDDGKVLLHCHAGCVTSDITRAAGIEMTDLFPPKDAAPAKPRIVAEYDYRDEQGELLYQALRLEPKSFRQRRPFENGWEWRVPAEVRRVLYRTPELFAARGGALAFVVEGEKDADAVATKTGALATTNAGGADKWQQTFAEQLKGKRVVVLPDNDAAGQKHAGTVVASLLRAGVTHAVLTLPGLPEKGDVSDWFAAGGTGAELVALAESAINAGREFMSAPERLDSATEKRKALAAKVIPFNISYLDDVFLGIHPTDFVIATAGTGAGKTTLGTLVAEKAARSGKHVYFFALEAHKGEIEQRMTYREICALARKEGIPTDALTFNGWMYGHFDKDLLALEKLAVRNLQDELETLHTFYRGSSFGAKDITRTFESIGAKADLIVLDHLHFVDTDGDSENAGLSAVVKAIRNSALDVETPVFVIAHLRKADTRDKRILPDISHIHGSSDASKASTKVITVASLQGVLPNGRLGVANTLMHAAKDRYAGTGNIAGIMRYDLAGLDYAQGYAAARINGSATDLQQLHSHEVPRWAKRGCGLAGKMKNIENGKAVD